MKVCILGNSLSSLSLAKALVNKNIYVDIIAKKKLKTPDFTRTIGITKTNAEFYNKFIINTDKIIWKINQIHIFSENLKKEKLLNFENNNSLFYILKNANLFEIIKKSLSKNKYFKIVNYDDNLNYSKNYNLVINSDYSDQISKKYFSKKIQKKYNSNAYTTVIKHKAIDNNIATQIFTKIGPLAFLPISKNETSIVYSIYGTSYKKIENIYHLIKEYNPKYKIEKIEKIKYFELKSLSLRSYYSENILAFGDLLHRIHPLAGQGFNMTIRDIKILLDIIISKQSLGLPFDSSICEEFEKKSRHKNFIFASGIDFVYEFFNFERKIKNNTLSKSIQLIGNNPSINKFFTRIADKGLLF